MTQVAISVDVSHCEADFAILLNLIPFELRHKDYWQAVLDVWLVDYAAGGVDFDYAIKQVATKMLSYKSESLSEAEDKVTALMSVHNNEAVFMNPRKDIVTIQHSGFINTQTGYIGEPIDIILNMVVAALKIAFNKAWLVLEGGLYQYTRNRTYIHSIELVVAHKGLLIFQIEV